MHINNIAFCERWNPPIDFFTEEGFYPNKSTYENVTRPVSTIGAAGVPGESVVVENFSGQRGDEKYFGIVTSPDCYPVQVNFFSNETGLVTFS
jgi:hypothetical protein